MQVAGVVDIQNMYSDKVPEITLEMVLLHCSNFFFMDFILEEKCTWLGIEI